MCNEMRCPLNGQVCDGCLNSEEPADGPFSDMVKPSERDWDRVSSKMLRAGSFGL